MVSNLIFFKVICHGIAHIGIVQKTWPPGAGRARVRIAVEQR